MVVATPGRLIEFLQEVQTGLPKARYCLIKGHINIKILQNMIPGIPLNIGPWNQKVRSLCLCGLLGP